MTAVEVSVVLASLVAFALVSRKLDRWPITMPMVFVGFGVVADALGLVNIRVDEEGVSVLGEVALAVVLFSDAVRIDVRSLREEFGLPLRLLVIGLPLSIILGAVGVGVLLGDLGIWEAALVAAVLAPTDAALGQAVVENESVPQRVRQGLNVESGLNDGIALPAVLLFAALAAGEDTSAGFWGRFVAQQVGGGLLVGLAIGIAGGWLINRSRRADWIDGIYAQLATLALALLTLFGAEAVGANGFIAAFVGGLAFGVVADRGEQLEEYTEDTGRLLSLVTFFLFGNAFVLAASDSLSVAVVVCVLLLLTLGRVVPVFIATLGAKPNWRTVVFVGWFGPRGLASILFGLLLIEEGLSGADELFAIITWTVVGSVVLHGMTARWGADAYGRWFEMQHHRHDDMVESVLVADHRTRRPS